MELDYWKKGIKEGMRKDVKDLSFQGFSESKKDRWSRSKLLETTEARREWKLRHLEIPFLRYSRRGEPGIRCSRRRNGWINGWTGCIRNGLKRED
jgi:hypothetical protein